MADFCWNCTVQILGMPAEENDLKGLTTEADTAAGLYASVLCEGCGFILVDHTGKRVPEPSDKPETEGKTT
jgi:hypothetical protein